ncbi:MAG: DUF2807 domain-containing protein [Bacteroidales bacterium]|nr:DUF2807 domain-containing protein [Bacteroidales bacterium]
MKFKIRILTLAISFFFIAANAQNESSKTILISDFHTLNTKDNIKVELVQASSNSIEFLGSETEKTSISYSIENGVLKLSASNPSASDHVRISVSNLNKIEASDLTRIDVQGVFAGNELSVVLNDISIFSGPLELNSLIVEVNDASAFETSGSVKSFKLTANDAAKVNTLNMNTGLVSIELNDAAKAQIQSKDAINAKISDASSLSYLSDAENISIEINDVAKVKQLKSIYDNADNEAKLEDFDESFNREITDILVKIDSSTKNLNSIDAKEWYEKLKRSPQKFNGNWGGVCLGFNNYIDATYQLSVPVGYEYLDAKFTRSLTFSLNLLEQNINIYKQKVGLITGLGFQWNNYFFANNATVFGDSNIVYGGFDVVNANKYTKSKLTSAFITIPLIFEYQTNNRHNSKSFHINAGAILGLRLTSHTKIVMEETGKQKYKYHNDFYLNPIRVDLTVGIGYGLLNLIGTYSVTTLFKDNKGPQLYPVSLGLYLVLW